ncbi:MAG: AIR synthase-related protein, partial [Peptococcaceae bacterium]|nr:AIR synthase-related protein [Peptococcaceae bacterium]
AGLAGQEIEDVMIRVMLNLNKEAARVMSLFNVHACTDVSGFGLLGHLREMLGANLTALLSYQQVPILEQVWDVLNYGGVSSGTHANARHLQQEVRWDASLSPHQQLVLFDSQTSGGLLIAAPEDTAQALVAKLREAGTLASAVIGQVKKRVGKAIEIML